MHGQRKATLGLLLAMSLLAAPALAQSRTSRRSAADDLQLTIDDPADWSPAASGIHARGVTVAARSSIRVSGTARHPLGIAEVLLNRNRASSAEAPDGSTQFIGYVRVEERMTSAEVTVVTKTGLRIPVRYNITPTKPPPPAATPAAAWEAKTAAAGFTGKRYAVIIGISRYEDKEINGLKYADEDAKAFYDFLRSPLAGMGGIEPENIEILLDEAATYRNMKVALFDFLKNATENDVVYIYFAGHGAPDPDRPDNLYLLPYDTKASQIGGTGFPMEDMNKALRQVSAAHKILITDACHSGGVTSSGSRGLELNAINSAFLDRLSSSHGVHATFTASAANQLSFEGSQWGGGHGVFTYYLLRGLSGAADADGDHIVDLGEVMKYVTDSVSAATARKQVPSVGETAFNASFPVAVVLPGQEVQQISAEEIAKYHQVSNVMTAALESPWVPPDSLTLVAGLPDTLRVTLQNDSHDVIPPSLLRWTSSNPAVATIDPSGVVNPVAQGTVQISASREGRKVTTLIRVLPHASDVVFSPADTVLQLVPTERFRVQSDLLIGTDQWVRGMPPRLTLSDTLTLSRQPDLEFVAYREGTATLIASIAGRTKRWTIHVVPPTVRIKPVPVTLALDDSVPLGAWRVRPDGRPVGDASNVVWRAADTTRAIVRNGRLVARGVGRTTVIATLGNATDSASVVVLGDLLIGISGAFGRQIATVALRTGEVTRLLPKGVSGSEPSLSPKGDRIAFVSNKRLYVMDADGTNIHRLTPDMNGLFGARLSSYEEHSPSWTNDGSRVVFISNAHGNYDVLAVTADGRELSRLTSTSEQERSVAAARDAPQLAFERVVSQDVSDLVITLPDGSGERQFKTITSFDAPSFRATKPQFLPGATKIVYVHRHPGRGGESLHILDAQTGQVIQDLALPQKDQAIVFAVSPDGERIALHRVAEWGKGNNAILIMNRSGALLKTITVGPGMDIESIAWGAAPVPVRPKDGK